MSNARDLSKMTNDNLVKLWVNFRGNSTVVIRRSLGVTSVTDAGVGIYVLNFEAGRIADTNYGIIALNRDGNNDSTVVNNTGFMAADTKSTSQLTLRRTYQGTYYDSPEVDIVIVGTGN
jgi:hypothetical protein